MKIKLQPREKLIILIAVFSLLGYGFYTYWYTPYDAKIVSANAEIAKVQKDTAQLSALVTKETEYKARYPEIQTKAISQKQQLTTIEGMPSVMADVKQMIEANGVTVKNISYDKSSPKKGLDPLLDYRIAKVTFNGDYTAIFNAIKDLETTMRRTFTVTDLAMSKLEKSNSLTGTMSVEMYFAKNPLAGFEYTPMLESMGRANPFSQ